MPFADAVAALITNQTEMLSALQALPAEVKAAYAPQTAEFMIYVDPVAGNDANLGTQAAPLQTIMAAVKLAPQGFTSRIILPASSAATCNITDTTGTAMDLQGRTIRIGTANGSYNTALYPQVRFEPITAGGAPRFTGQGTLAFEYVNVVLPAFLNTPAADQPKTCAISSENGFPTSVFFIACQITMFDAPAAIVYGTAVDMILLNTTIIVGSAGYTPVLLDIRTNASSRISSVNTVLPTGFTLRGLIKNESGLVGADGYTPLGLLANFAFH